MRGSDFDILLANAAQNTMYTNIKYICKTSYKTCVCMKTTIFANKTWLFQLNLKMAYWYSCIFLHIRIRRSNLSCEQTDGSHLLECHQPNFPSLFFLQTSDVSHVKASV